jgi:hypothetical protein
MDILEELRRSGTAPGEWSYEAEIDSELLGLAAAEIERLRAQAQEYTAGLMQRDVELKRLRAILRETLPFLDGIQNTTDVEVFREAGALLDKIKAALANQQKAPEAEVWLTCSQCGARLVMAPKSEVEAIAPYLCTKCSPPE